MTRPSNADATRLPGVHAPYRGGLAIIVVCLGSAWLGTVIAIALSPALPFIAATMGKGHDGAMVAQLLQTLPAITMLVGAGLAGYFSERWGRRLVIVAALAIYALSGATGLLTETLYPLVASRLILGFAGGVILTTSYAMMGEYFEGPRRERMLGFGSMMGSISAIVNLLAAGPMVDHLGWRAPFALYLPALILIPFALVGMHKDRTRAAHSRLSWKPVLALWPYLILLTAYTIGMYMSVIQTPLTPRPKPWAPCSKRWASQAILLARRAVSIIRLLSTATILSSMPWTKKQGAVCAST